MEEVAGSGDSDRVSVSAGWVQPRASCKSPIPPYLTTQTYASNEYLSLFNACYICAGTSYHLNGAQRNDCAPSAKGKRAASAESGSAAWIGSGLACAVPWAPCGAKAGDTGVVVVDCTTLEDGGILLAAPFAGPF